MEPVLNPLQSAAFVAVMAGVNTDIKTIKT